MKRIIIILLIVTTVLILGGVVYLLFFGSSGTKQPKTEAPVPKPTATVHKEAISYSPSESFVTNIKNSSKYLKVKVTLELKDEKSKKHFESNQAKIKDTIINVLRSKTEGDLFDDNAQENLKTVIKAALETKLELTDMLDLYIDEFVIQ